MTWIGMVLGSLGLLDIIRPRRFAFNLRSASAVLLPAAATLGTLWLGGVSLRVAGETAIAITLLAVLWGTVTMWSLNGARRPWPALTSGVALLSALVVASPYSPRLGGRLQRWYSRVPLEAIAHVQLDRFMAVVGCSILLVSSGNVVVRLVLAAAGSSFLGNEQQLKGGRVLGPMERLLIFGLGLAGNFAAASLIVAAKGLLRFPELQYYRQDIGVGKTLEFKGQRIDALTEYFLIGSLSSWMFALAALVLI